MCTAFELDTINISAPNLTLTKITVYLHAFGSYVFLYLLLIVDGVNVFCPNAAAKKPTAQISNHRDYYSSNSVDGNTASTCSQTMDHLITWWYVDLYLECQVTEVRVYNYYGGMHTYTYLSIFYELLYFFSLSHTHSQLYS